MKKDLCVLTYENPTDEIRMETRKYFYEVKPNIFIGTLRTDDREKFWKLFEKSGTLASIIYADDSERGFTCKSTYGSCMLSDFDRVLLPTQKKSLSITDVYAKPEKRLMDHLVESGTVAKAILKFGRGKDTIEHIAKLIDVDANTLINFISFLVASHDIGKAHPGFQKRLYSSSKNEHLSDVIESLMYDGIIDARDSEKIRHERYSRDILKEYFNDLGIDRCFADVVAFHHQGKDQKEYGNVNEKVCCYLVNDPRWQEWKNLHKYIIAKLRSLWEFDETVISNITDGDEVKHYLNGLMYFILSVMVTSDWIVSGSIWNRTLSICNTVEDAAKKFIEDNELSYVPIKDRFNDVSWNSVFPFDMNALQKHVTDLSNTYCDLCIIEYPCGYGKTEASLAMAVKLGESKSGIYLAAPTTSTAKGLAVRCRDIAKAANLNINIPELDSSMIWSDSDMEKIPKDIWSNKTRHQLLYPFSVGTIDQLLKSIITYRYSCIGTLGLSDKVVIVDEVHAYDTYMLTELRTLIVWCRFLHVPVILLSATLPTKTKKSLCEAAGIKHDDETYLLDYPLVTTVRNGVLEQNKIECTGKTVSIKTVKVSDTVDELYKSAFSVDRGCIALITPTVDNAFELYDRLVSSDIGCDVVLYNGRMTDNCKAKRIQSLLSSLGKDRSNRPEKMIVVATSIIEQSLDVDFDYMFTALAPIDLLIQRLGRVHRHSDSGTVRETIKIDAPFTVIVPTAYGNLSKIYDQEILSRTEAELDKITCIDTVKSVRSLIDSVYNNYISGNENVSRISASGNVLGDPTNCEVVDTAPEKYIKYNDKMPKTRKSTYPSLDVIIIKEQLNENYTFDDIKNIMLNNRIHSVPKYKLKEFNAAKTDIVFFQDCALYISDSLCVVGNDGGTMELTERGLRFE